MSAWGYSDGTALMSQQPGGMGPVTPINYAWQSDSEDYSLPWGRGFVEWAVGKWG